MNQQSKTICYPAQRHVLCPGQFCSGYKVPPYFHHRNHRQGACLGRLSDSGKWTRCSWPLRSRSLSIWRKFITSSSNCCWPRAELFQPRDGIVMPSSGLVLDCRMGSKPSFHSCGDRFFTYVAEYAPPSMTSEFPDTSPTDILAGKGLLYVTSDTRSPYPASASSSALLVGRKGSRRHQPLSYVFNRQRDGTGEIIPGQFQL